MESATSAVLSATATPATSLSSASSWSSITAHAFNVSSTYFQLSSGKDLVRLPFRIAHDIDHVIFRSLPRYLLQATGLFSAAIETENIAAPAANAAVETVVQVGETAALSWTDLIAEAFQASTFKSYLGMLQYVTSRWAFTCLAVAIVLNRIQVYGSARQRVFLSWNKRLALRLVPILLFIPQIYHLMCAMRCQTSPDYSLYRHGDNNKYSYLDWSSDGGALHSMTSKALYWQTDEQSCSAVGMSRPERDVRAPYGSFSLLWPTFLRLAASHMVEGISCSLQQLPVMTEVGMSVFEHSLAFAEAENMIISTLTLLAKEAKKATKATGTATTVTPTPEPTPRGTVMASGSVMALSDAVSSLFNPHMLDRVNVPVEVLLIALLSTGNAFSSHIVAILGKQHRWRLVNTGVWGCLFMGSFIWGFFTPSSMSRSDEDDMRPVTSLLHFPTVAIIGFLPHFIILIGIIVCFWIYAVAITLTAFALGTNPNIPQPTSLKQRFLIAHENLTAAIQLRAIRPRWSEDFYTALLRIGFSALTAASEAVFLNEGRSVEMRQFTWLEEERLDVLQLSRNTDKQMASFQILEEYGVPSATPGSLNKGGVWESGYAKERKFDKKEGDLAGKNSFTYPTPRQDGVGAMQRGARFYLLFIYLRGIMFLIAGWAAYVAGLILDKIGLTSRPSWLRRIVGRSLKDASERARVSGDMMGSHGWQANAPDNTAMDVETEMRFSLRRDYEGQEAEAVLDERMYQWWKDGGWFGNKDLSGSYNPTEADEDITSVVSMSTASNSAGDSADEQWEDELEGARTPTQTSPNPSRQTWSFSGVEVRTRESTPSESAIDTPLDPATLARLLNPQDKASREEARILASHLDPTVTPNRIMTRSQYRQHTEREHARILLAGRLPQNRTQSAQTAVPSIPLYGPTATSGPQPLTPDEEAEMLESLLLERRSKTSQPSPSDRRETVAGDETAAGLGVLCVVCQTSPRTVIAWPCRCLCVCEDCRLSLAMNNFGNCVTCRRAVGGFVRLWVP